MAKRWVVAPPVEPSVAEQMPNVHPLVLQLLASRGCTTQAAADEFLSPDYTHHVHDPYQFRQMRVAVDRVYAAVASGERVAVYGDYDADGVSSTCVMAQTLRRIGCAEVEVYIPHRMNEGHSMNEAAVRSLAAAGVKLIVTVDCGISNAAEVEVASSLGMDVVITDHHLESQALPAALAVVNPHLEGETYPFADLCGTGVAFKVAQALLADPRCALDGSAREAWEKWLLDLVAIGTIADIMPLVGENRTLVRYGLTVLGKTRRPGLRAMAELANVDLARADAYTVGFVIGPRLNAAGRMEHANAAYELLATEDPAEAARLAAVLQRANSDRQAEVERMGREALAQVGTLAPGKSIAFAYSKSWSSGLVGLVASKLVQTYGVPAFALGYDGQRYVGSGRSLPGFDVTHAMSQLSHLLVRFGGHAAACGCTVTEQNLPEFIAGMEQLAAAQLAGADRTPTLAVDAEVKLAEITWPVLDQLAQFEPYGQGNPRPVLVSRNLEVAELQPLGKDGSHLRMHVREGGADVYKTISFGTAATWGQQLQVGQRVDLAYEPGINEWNGTRELQLKVVDWREAERAPGDHPEPGEGSH